MSGAERSVILCTAGYDHTIRFWEAPTGMCHRTLQYADSVSGRQTAQTHAVPAAAHPCLTRRRPASPILSSVKKQVNRLEITPDKQYLAVAGNPHIRLFDIHSTRPDHMGQFDGHTNNVTAIGFQKDRKWSTQHTSKPATAQNASILLLALTAYSSHVVHVLLQDVLVV